LLLSTLRYLVNLYLISLTPLALKTLLIYTKLKVKSFFILINIVS
jgi:hypothetical protein